MRHIALAVLVSVGACLDPTQITVEVTSAIPCSDVTEIAITAGTLGMIEMASPSATANNRCSGTLVLVPSASKDIPGVRVVAGLHGKSAADCVRDKYQGGCIVARRAVRYVPHTKLRLPVLLDRACIDVACDSDRTCIRGECVPATIDRCDVSDCQPSKGDGGTPDAGDAGDAGTFVQRAIGGPGDDFPTSIARDTSGNLYVTGGFAATASLGGPMVSTSAAANAFLVSYEPSALGYRWQVAPKSTSPSLAMSVSTANNVFWAGWSSGPIDLGFGNFGMPNATVPFRVTTDAQGNPLNAQLDGAGPNDRALASATDALGDTFIGGTCNPNTMFGNMACKQGDGFIAAFKSNGAYWWSIVLPFAPVLALSCDSMHLIAGGHADGYTNLGDGFVQPPGGGGDAWVASYALNGVCEWSIVFAGDNQLQSVTAVAQSPTSVYALGEFQGKFLNYSSQGGRDIFLARLDPTKKGASFYTRTLGGSSDDIPGGIVVDSGDKAYTCGSFQNKTDFGNGKVVTATSGKDMFALALDQVGATIDVRAFAGSNDVQCVGVALQPPKTLFLTGWFDGTVTFGGAPLNSAGGKDTFVVRLDP